MSCDEVQIARSLYMSAKKARTDIDQETKSLENRIRMIKFEESRASKRIQQTRERISEVYKARTRYIEDKHNKNISKEKETKEKTEIKQNLSLNKTFHQEKIQYTIKEIFNIKQNIGKRVRGWKEYIRRNKQQQSIENRRQNRKIKETIQLSSKQGAMRLKLLEDFKEQKAHINYIKKVEIENAKRLETEKLLNSMGKEEKLLIERVKNIHDIQKQTVEELEKVYM